MSSRIRNTDSDHWLGLVSDSWTVVYNGPQRPTEGPLVVLHPAPKAMAQGKRRGSAVPGAATVASSEQVLTCHALTMIWTFIHALMAGHDADAEHRGYGAPLLKQSPPFHAEYLSWKACTSHMHTTPSSSTPALRRGATSWCFVCIITTTY